MFSEAPVSDLLRIKRDPLAKLNLGCTVLSPPKQLIDQALTGKTSIDRKNVLETPLSGPIRISEG